MNAPVPDDEALLAKAAAGDADALGALYDRHAPLLLGLCQRVLRSRRDAEDLVHDVFIEAWQRAGTYRASRGSVRAWLAIRARSRAIDRARSLAVARRKGLLPPDQDPAGFEAACEPDTSLQPDARRARDAVAALPEARARVLELAYFGGLSCSEIAEQEGLPLGTVKSRLRTALADLRRHFRVAGATGSDT